MDSTPPVELLLDPKPTKADSPMKLSFTEHALNSDLNTDMDLVEYEYKTNISDSRIWISIRVFTQFNSKCILLNSRVNCAVGRDENGSNTDGYHQYYICFHISVEIRIVNHAG
jgi:hypothetical protein